MSNECSRTISLLLPAEAPSTRSVASAVRVMKGTRDDEPPMPQRVPLEVPDASASSAPRPPAPAPLILNCLLLICVFGRRYKVPPLVTMIRLPPAPSLSAPSVPLLAAAPKTPPVTVIVPTSPRLPVLFNMSVPAPALVNPPAPARTAPMVAVWLLTVIVGEPAETLNVNGSPEPVFKTQFVSGVASPKTRFPIVRAPSRVTVLRFVMFSVLKSAVLSAPLAITPLFQFTAVLQLPPALPLTRLVQVPFWARMFTVQNNNAAARAMIIFDFLCWIFIGYLR